MSEQMVIMLHGLARTSRSMAKLANHLVNEGYVVHNIQYPSTRLSIDALTEWLHERISNQIQVFSGTVHFVTHSMGGIVTRSYLGRYRPARLGRVVMLAPPNQGSEMADFLKDNFLFRTINGPAGQELGRKVNHAFSRFGEVNYEVGIIAGTVNREFFSKWIVEGIQDGKVSVECTKIAGMKDHIVLPVTHTYMMRNPMVIAQVQHFLKHGVFKKN